MTLTGESVDTRPGLDPPGEAAERTGAPRRDDPTARREVWRGLDEERRATAAAGCALRDEGRGDELALADRRDCARRHGLQDRGQARHGTHGGVARDEAGPDPGATVARVAVASRQHRPFRPEHHDEELPAVAFDRADGARGLQADLLAFLGGQDDARHAPGAASRPRHSRAPPRGRARRRRRNPTGPTMIPCDSRPIGGAARSSAAHERPGEAGEIGSIVDADRAPRVRRACRAPRTRRDGRIRRPPGPPRRAPGSG